MLEKNPRYEFFLDGEYSDRLKKKIITVIFDTYPLKCYAYNYEESTG